MVPTTSALTLANTNNNRPSNSGRLVIVEAITATPPSTVASLRVAAAAETAAAEIEKAENVAIADETENLNSEGSLSLNNGAASDSTSRDGSHYNGNHNKRRSGGGGGSTAGYLNAKGDESRVSGTQSQVDDVQQVEASDASAAPDAFSRSNYVVTTTMKSDEWQPEQRHRSRSAKIMRG